MANEIRLSVRISEEMEKHLEKYSPHTLKGKNYSAYIQDLIRKDMQQKQKDLR